jgi:methyl-accepting chemotaxis protein
VDARQTDAPAESVDAFILFNEHENVVAKIVDELSSLGISTFFWRRDIPFGGRWQSIESSQLRNAHTVVLFLGTKGWGPNHLKLTEEARALKKTIIPVLIDAPPEKAFDEAEGLFRDHRYVDLARQGSVEQLAEEIHRRRPVPAKDAESQRREVRERVEVPSGWMGELLARRSITDATPVAREILGRAASINPLRPGSAEISTTRLLIAMFAVGRTFERDTSPASDCFGVLALSRVLGSDERFAPFHEIQSQYLSQANPTDANVRSVTTTRNVTAILAAASSDLAAVFGSEDILSADALVAALLSQPDTKVEDRLEERRISLPVLRSAVLAEIQSLDPSRIDQWRKALGAVAPAPEAAPTTGPAVGAAGGPSATPPPGSPTPPSTTTSTATSPSATPDVTTITVARMGNDNPDRENLDDKLGVKDEAHAFARVAAARQVDPPLAFGIFGDWGSGKSFFMRLIQEHVEKLASKRADEAKTDLFHENIVQIRFNAWHYVETNLWASLVDYIFFELDRWVLKKLSPTEQNTLFDKLATARDLTLESAERLVRRRKEQKVAATRVAGAERELTAAREKVGATPRLFWEVVRTNFERLVTKKDLEKAAATLGFDRLAGDAESLKKALDSLEAEGQRAKVVTNGIRHRLLAAPSLIFILAAIILVPPGLLWLRDAITVMAGSSPNLKAFLENINTAVLGAAGVLASAAALIGVITKKVQSAVTTLEGFRGDLNQVIADQIKTPAEAVKSAQENLAKLTADVAEARALLATTSDRLAEAAREYAGGTGRGRLLRFVRERATDGQYAKHLGLIAAVRKDFTELSAMISTVDKSVQDESDRQIQAYKKRVQALIDAADGEKLLTEDDKEKLRNSADISVVTPTPTFQRIILYIDDLDRCPPQKVVDVLQAVHLLLTFPLFVVVVAVDARWVSRSLETHYINLIRKDASAEATPGATARDYLEKIFQVPYWVRAMTAQGSRDLLMGLAAPPIEAPANSAPATGSTGGDTRSQPAATTPADGGSGAGAAGGSVAFAPVAGAAVRATDAATNNQAGQGAIPFPGLSQNKGPDPGGGASSARTPSGTAPAGTTARIAARALELTEGEQAFMKFLAPCVGSTPRSALRFLNVYRVIKASLGAEDLQKLEKDGGYRGLMTQLAVVTGSPALQKRWSELLNVAGRDDTLQQIEPRLKAETWFTASPNSHHLYGALAAFWSNRQTPKPDDKGPAVSETQEAVDKVLKNGIADLGHYGDLANRYSFGA